MLSLIKISLTAFTFFLYYPVQAEAIKQPNLESCKSVYESCLKATGLPKDQILMGVRGICHDQQALCEQFQSKVSSCIKDYGMNACKRIFRFEFN